MPSYKLYYADARGRAETARLLFAAKGVQFEDVRIETEDLPNFLPETPFSKVPVLDVDGERFAQSNAINIYLATEFGLHGKTNLEALAVNQVLLLNEDFVSEFVKLFVPRDPAKKAEAEKQYLEVQIPKYLGYFERLLKENGTGYFVGSSLTVADLSVFEFVTANEEKKAPGILDQYPTLKAFTEKVLSNPNIKAYVATRKGPALYEG